MSASETSKNISSSPNSVGAAGGARDNPDIFKIEHLTMAYDDYVVMRDLNFTVKKEGRLFCEPTSPVSRLE